MDAQLAHLLTVAEELAGLGSWQQDLESGQTLWSDGIYRILGTRPDRLPRDQEAILAVIHPDDRDRVRALLATVATREPGDEAETEFSILRPDGAVRNIRARSRVEGDGIGRATRWSGVVQDVTDERLGERELRAHYAVSQALRDWESLDEGAVDLLRRMGTALDYPLGSLWLWSDEAEALVCRAFWSAPDIAPEPFESAKRSQSFKPGEGKPGLAWQLREPVLTADIAADERFVPQAAALALGLRSSLTFPAVGPDGPVAVLSFYAFEPRAASASLVRTLTAIGRELGRFLSRRRVDLGPRPLSEREIEILRRAAEGLSGPQIAAELVISRATVKTHFENIYEKLGVSDRSAAVAHALRIGLIR